MGVTLVSTMVSDSQAHAEDAIYLVKKSRKNIVANDDNYALAA